MSVPARSDRSLTGVWQGLYSYPGGESVSFVATVIESGTFVSGTTHETCATFTSPNATLYAMLSGVRAGQEVTFTKSYDGSADWTHTVEYDGALNADATEIEGQWSIEGMLRGRFMMMRTPGKEVSVERGVLIDA